MRRFVIQRPVQVCGYLLLSLWLSGCAFFSPARSQSVSVTLGAESRVYLSDQVFWTLPSPDVIKGHFMVIQQVKGRYGDQSFDLLFQIEKKPGQLSLLGMTVSGQQLLQLVYRDGEVSGHVSPLVGDRIKLSYLVSDLLLAYGSGDVFNTALADQDIIAREIPSKSRVIGYNKRPLISIKYSGQWMGADQWPEIVHYRNLGLGYELEIKTLSKEFL
ncbi:DUF3261 domain-containing protein [Endozoicomonas atrinae]|uniref:DUF3261 domain-containing protein n=1 Tax=Endozoicomonas atrinae TaxID=1333660 RepID=UPI00082617B3|nr:DUF3261 domain-containing protein [Endozoicomonas atrinae]